MFFGIWPKIQYSILKKFILTSSPLCTLASKHFFKHKLFTNNTNIWYLKYYTLHISLANGHEVSSLCRTKSLSFHLNSTFVSEYLGLQATATWPILYSLVSIQTFIWKNCSNVGWHQLDTPLVRGNDSLVLLPRVSHWAIKNFLTYFTLPDNLD